MHIPDGWISPSTAAVMYAAAAPFWYVAGQRAKRALTDRAVPLLSLFAALSFAVMMFNIPLPGATTGHVTGGAIMAVVLGPWASVLALSVVLVVQAVFFGDGGIMALGANCFNIAVAVPLVSYAVYRVLSAGSEPTSLRRSWAAAIGAYLALNVAAALTAIEIGIQPLLFSEGGYPLYSPFNLSQTLPIMLITHGLVVAPLEALITGLAVRSLPVSVGLFGQGASPRSAALRPQSSRGHGPLAGRRLWLVLPALVLLSPLGLLAPGTAFGEWSPEELGQLLGYVPSGLGALSGFNPLAVFPGYSVAGAAGAGFPFQSLAYVFSAIVGIAAVGGASWMIGRALTKGAGAAVVSGKSAANPLADQLIAPAGRSWPRPGSHFVEKTIADVVVALEHVLFSEKFAARPGALQRLDPRAKLVSVVVLLVAVSLATRVPALLLFYALTLLLAAVSRIPLGFFFKRVWLFIPLFAGIVAIPALFSFVTPGREVLVLADFGASPVWGPFTLPARLAITAEGLTGFGLLVLRVATLVSLAALLVLTTRWWLLLKALQSLRVPQSAILILTMTYRYIYTVLRTVEQTFLARKSRTVGYVRGGDNRRWLGAAMATMVGKSYQTSNEVYLAMVFAGFSGEVRLAHSLRLRPRDIAWVVGSVAFAAAVLLVERSLFWGGLR